MFYIGYFRREKHLRPALSGKPTWGPYLDRLYPLLSDAQPPVSYCVCHTAPHPPCPISIISAAERPMGVEGIEPSQGLTPTHT